VADRAGLVLLAGQAHLIRASYLSEGFRMKSEARLAVASAAHCFRQAGEERLADRVEAGGPVAVP
jgi:hypothetical protein